MSGFVKLYRDLLYSKLKPAEIIVYMAIADQYESALTFNKTESNGMIQISIRELSEKINVSRNTISKAIDHLIELGMIVKQPSLNGNPDLYATVPMRNAGLYANFASNVS